MSLSVWLPSNIPSFKVLKYRPVPPQRIGDLFFWIILSILSSINSIYSPADIFSLRFLNPIRWWGTSFNWLESGWAVPIGIPL